MITQLHRQQRSPSNPSPVLPSIPAKQDIMPVLMHIQLCFKSLNQLKVKSGFCFLPHQIVFCQIRVQASYERLHKAPEHVQEGSECAAKNTEEQEYGILPSLASVEFQKS